MALDNRDFNGQEAMMFSGLSESGEQSWRWSPEPVRLESAPATRFAPARFDVVTASFEFPCALIDARAQELVQVAVRQGQRHSLSLWRVALRDSLERTSRDAAHAPEHATCAALFWDRVGDGYRVAVTFELPPHRHSTHAQH